MNLFNYGVFKLHSGQYSNFKIDCDALTHEDLCAIARKINDNLNFSKVVGIPRGGIRLSKYLERYCEEGYPVLIVDDVLTTGKSMEEARQALGGECIGLVIFNRGKCPTWVSSVCDFNF